MKCLCLLILLISIRYSSLKLAPFSTVFSWKQLDYKFPDEKIRQSYINSGAFIPENNAPTGLSVWNDKLFLAVPRWKKGVPATLNYVNLTEFLLTNNSSPLLIPYPNWELNDINRAGSLVNIIRPRVDACGRLWAVDSGVDASFDEHNVIRPQRLIAINLQTNEIILEHTFNNSVVLSNSLLADLVIDVGSNCNDTHIYISDNTAPALIVYSLTLNESWRVTHNFFHVDPLNGFFNVSGVSFTLPDGILGLSLGPGQYDESTLLYFHSIGGVHEFGVKTKLLKNRTALADHLYYRQFRIIGYRGLNSQATSSVFDKNTGIIYMTQINTNSIACWNTLHSLSPRTFYIISRDDQKLSYTNDIVIQPEMGNVFILSNKLPILIYSKYNLNETNFYVHVSELQELKNLCISCLRPLPKIQTSFA